MSLKKIGKRLRALRQRMGLGGRELGRLAGMTQVGLTRLESGRRGFRSVTLMKLAEALEIPVVYFFIEDLRALRATTADVLEKQGISTTSRLLSALADPGFLHFAEEAALFYAGNAKRLSKMDETLAEIPWRRIKRKRGRPRKHK